MSDKYKNGAWKTTSKAQDDFAKLMWIILEANSMGTNHFQFTGLVTYTFEVFDGYETYKEYEFTVNRKGVLVDIDPRTAEQKAVEKLTADWKETYKSQGV
ncbi:MAG: hypothetical protein WC677_07575 [Clostridia bacterium]|jgi:hypothetical protein